MTPDFCKTCEHLLPGGCCQAAKNCKRWLEWFGKEWRAIKNAADHVKEGRQNGKG